MVEDILNSTKVEEPVKKEIIIEFDKERSDYADMLKGILSICNQSDAAISEQPIGFGERILKLMLERQVVGVNKIAYVMR